MYERNEDIKTHTFATSKTLLDKTNMLKTIFIVGGDTVIKIPGWGEEGEAEVVALEADSWRIWV